MSAAAILREQRTLRAALAERMPDFEIDRLESVAQALPLGRLHQGLANLLGLRPEDFVLRTAALHSLHRLRKARFEVTDRDAALYWLNEVDRTTVWRNLVDGGFVRHSDRGWTITQEGAEVYSLIQLLFELGRQPTLTFSAILNDALEEMNGNPSASLQNLTNQMRQLEADLTDALMSQSSVRMAEQLNRCAKAIGTARQVVNQARRHGANPALTEEVQDLHYALSLLIGAYQRVARMHADMVQAFIHLPSGTTMHDITATLMAAELEDLAALGHAARAATVMPRICIREDMLASAAERFLTREIRTPPSEPGPSRPAEAGEPQEIQLPLALKRLAADLQAIKGDSAELIDFLATGDAKDALLRLYALDLLGAKDLPHPSYHELSKQPWRVEQLAGFDRREDGPVAFLTKSRLVKVKR